MAESSAKSVITHEISEKILKNYAEKTATLVSFDVKPKEIVGFFGNYNKMTLIYYTKEDRTKLEKARFLCKSLPEGNKIMKEMNIFRKEVMNYNNLIRPFLKLVTFPFAANCYYTDENVIILDDLEAKGFKIAESSYFTYEQNKSLMKTLGRFHAASLIFEEKQSTNGKSFRINEKFPFLATESTYSFTEGHPRFKWCKIATECLVELMKLMEKENVEKLTQYFEHVVFNEVPEFIKPSKKFRNVLNQDGVHQYNVLFNEKLHSVLVDFQLTRYAPPAYDVLLTLHLNNGIKFLDKNKTRLIDNYYRALCKELKNHDLNPEIIFPRDKFDESLEHYLLPVLIEAAFCGTTIFISDELSHKIRHDDEVYREFMSENRCKFIIPDYQNIETFRKRYNQVLVPLVNCLKSNIKN